MFMVCLDEYGLYKDPDPEDNCATWTAPVTPPAEACADPFTHSPECKSDIDFIVRGSAEIRDDIKCIVLRITVKKHSSPHP